MKKMRKFLYPFFEDLWYNFINRKEIRSDYS